MPEVAWYSNSTTLSCTCEPDQFHELGPGLLDYGFLIYDDKNMRMHERMCQQLIHKQSGRREWKFSLADICYTIPIWSFNYGEKEESSNDGTYDEGQYN